MDKNYFEFFKLYENNKDHIGTPQEFVDGSMILRYSIGVNKTYEVIYGENTEDKKLNKEKVALYLNVFDRYLREYIQRKNLGDPSILVDPTKNFGYNPDNNSFWWTFNQGDSQKNKYFYFVAPTSVYMVNPDGTRGPEASIIASKVDNENKPIFKVEDPSLSESLLNEKNDAYIRKMPKDVLFLYSQRLSDVANGKVASIYKADPNVGDVKNGNLIYGPRILNEEEQGKWLSIFNNFLKPIEGELRFYDPSVGWFLNNVDAEKTYYLPVKALLINEKESPVIGYQVFLSDSGEFITSAGNHIAVETPFVSLDEESAKIYLNRIHKNNPKEPEEKDISEEKPIGKTYLLRDDDVTINVTPNEAEPGKTIKTSRFAYGPVTRTDANKYTSLNIDELNNMSFDPNKGWLIGDNNQAYYLLKAVSPQGLSSFTPVEIKNGQIYLDDNLLKNEIGKFTKFPGVFIEVPKKEEDNKKELSSGTRGVIGGEAINGFNREEAKQLVTIINSNSDALSDTLSKKLNIPGDIKFIATARIKEYNSKIKEFTRLNESDESNTTLEIQVVITISNIRKTKESAEMSLNDFIKLAEKVAEGSEEAPLDERPNKEDLKVIREELVKFFASNPIKVKSWGNKTFGSMGADAEISEVEVIPGNDKNLIPSNKGSYKGALSLIFIKKISKSTFGSKVASGAKVVGNILASDMVHDPIRALGTAASTKKEL